MSVVLVRRFASSACRAATGASMERSPAASRSRRVTPLRMWSAAAARGGGARLTLLAYEPVDDGAPLVRRRRGGRAAPARDLKVLAQLREKLGGDLSEHVRADAVGVEVIERVGDNAS